LLLICILSEAKLIYFHGRTSLLFYDFFYAGFSAMSLFTGRMLLAYNFFYGWATAVYGIFHHSYRSVPEALGTLPRTTCIEKGHGHSH
jgi:hypothetical protein